MNPSNTTGSTTRKRTARRPVASQRQPVPEPTPLDTMPAGEPGCELCSEQIVLMGLPYRIVLRCSHSAAD